MATETQKADRSKIAHDHSRTKTTFKFNKQTAYFVIFVLAWTILAMTASQLIAYPMAWILGEKISTPLWTCIYYALTYTLTLVLIIYIPPRIFNLARQRQARSTIAKTNTKTTQDSQNPLATNADEIGLQHLPTFVDIGLAPIGYIIYTIGATLVINLMKLFPWFQADQTQEVGFGYFITTGDRILAMLALVIIAPIAEEIIMRGWLYGKLRSRLKVPLAILLVSIVFAFLHGQWNVGVGVFMLSLVLCGLREITGTIWSGILLHIISNGIAFYLLYIAVI